VNVEILGLQQLSKSEGAQITKIINEILHAGDLEEYAINISFLNKSAMQDLCRQFKSKKKLTDVLSFPVPALEASLIDTQTFLGDIAICIDKAREQAKLYGHSFLEEVAVLFAHGLFHLLGYDHEKSEEEANIQMQGEMYLLEKIGFSPELSLIGRV